MKKIKKNISDYIVMGSLGIVALEVLHIVHITQFTIK